MVCRVLESVPPYLAISDEFLPFESRDICNVVFPDSPSYPLQKLLFCFPSSECIGDDSEFWIFLAFGDEIVIVNGSKTTVLYGG